MHSFLKYYNLISEGENLSNKHRNMDERVKSGKILEDKIKTLLTPILIKQGYTVRPSTKEEEMYKKVDFYIKKQGSPEEGVQVKYRDQGEDILMELVRPYTETGVADTHFTGRDMKGDSKYYAVLAPDRKTIYWCNADELKSTAENLAIMFLSQREGGNRSPSYVDEDFGEIKLSRDPHSDQPKLMGFFNPRMFALKTYTANQAM